MTTNTPTAGQWVPYHRVPIGFEATYTGETALDAVDMSDADLVYRASLDGFVTEQYSVWGFAHTKPEDWNDEIRHMNRMQAALGLLSDETREIRAQIASLVGCDSGVPVTIDEILNAIGAGHLAQPSFHAGCWMSRGTRSTQPEQKDSMGVIEAVLEGYMAGRPRDDLIAAHPHAQGFIERATDWLGPSSELTDVQKLMLERMLLPFEKFAGHSEDHRAVFEDCFTDGGRGKALDARISALAGLPEIHASYRREYRENLASIDDPENRRIYLVCGHIADCVSEVSDCHHSTLRRVERWIYGIGTLTWDIPTRKAHVEGIRLGRLLFGYALGLDRWLQGIPMQFLLLDLGHIDLGFDPKNEILRVYAYLGRERTPVREWLASCLWYTLALMPPASLYKWGRRHKDLVADAEAKGLGVCQWMDAQLHRVGATS